MAQKVDEIYVRIGADVAGYEAAMKKAAATMESVGRRMTDVGKTLTMAVTAPIAALGVSILKTAGDFQASMNRVQAVSGATASEFAALEAKAKELGKTTMFSASEAADGMAFLSQAGFKASQTLAAMPDILNLAAAGQMDLARTADIASNIMGQFGIAAEDTGRVTNLLAATASSANTNIEQLSEAMKYLGPTAKSLGVSLEETAAVVGVLGDAGIQGSLAGRALGTSLVNLAKPSAQSAKAMKELGLKAFDVNGKFVGMKSLLSQIESGTKGMTDEMRAATLSALLGAESYQEINILLDKGSESFANYTDAITGTNKATEMAEIQSRGFNGALKTLGSAFEAVQLAIAGSGLLEFFAGLLEKGTAVLRWISELNPEILKWATIVAGVAAAIGPVLIVLGTMATTVLPALAAGFALLTGPVGLAIAAIVAGAALIIMNWEKVKAWFNGPAGDMFRRVGEAAQLAFGLIERLLSAIGRKAVDDFAPAVTNSMSIVEKAFVALGSILKNLIDGAIALLKMFTAFIDGDYSEAWRNMKLVAGASAKNITDIVAFMAIRIVDIIGAIFKKIPVIGEAIAGAMDVASAAISSFSANAKHQIDSVTGYYEDLELQAQAALKAKLALDKAYSDQLDEDRRLVKPPPTGGGAPPKPPVLPTATAGPGKITVPVESIQIEPKQVTFPETIGEKIRAGLNLDQVFADPAIEESFAALAGKLEIIALKSAALGDTFDANAAKTALFGETMNMFIDNGLVRTAEEIEAVTNRLNEMGIAGDTAGSMFEGFGAKLSGSIVSAAKSVASGAQTIAQAARGIIKSFISEGIAAVVAGTLKTYAMTGPGAIAIAAGAGAAAGALFERAIPKFAKGGIVSGPTVGLMGEYAGARNNPEVIAPLDRLQSMIGGGANNISGTFTIKGTDLQMVLEKQQRTSNYTGS